MAPFILLSWRPGEAGDAGEAALRRAFRASLEAKGWRLGFEDKRRWVFSSVTRAASVRRLGAQGLVVGDLYERNGEDAPQAIGVGSGEPLEMLSRLSARFWGRYVAVLDAPEPAATSVFRDPGGALDAFAWRTSSASVVASVLPDPLLQAFGPTLSIDWRAVQRQLAHPEQISAVCGLQGIRGVCPGECVILGDAGTASVQVWKPSSVVRQSDIGFAEGQDRVRSAVDTVFSAISRRAGRCLVEVSGGLDSSIVAATLVKQRAEVGLFINYAADHPSGDERSFAQALATHLDVPLTVKFKRAPSFAPTVIGEVATGARPCLVGLDDDYDADVSRQSLDVGASSLLTGQGGDGVFHQTASGTMLVDRRQRLGWQSINPTEVARVGRSTRQSVWRLVGLLLSGGPSGLRLAGADLPWIVDAPGPSHPWLHGIESMPPGKRQHIADLTYGLLNYGASRRTRTADVMHPLLSQPIIEACLAVPTDVLSQGGRGRALARAAFSDRLPPKIHQRRSKGELGPLYGRSMAAALPQIRPFLLEGRLVSQGMIDRRRLEDCLDQDHLALHGGMIDLLRAVAIEAWVRHWEQRIQIFLRDS